MPEETKINIVKVENLANESDAIVINAKPISIQRRVTLAKGPGGMPIIRELIIVETEASIGRILFILLSILIYALIFQIFFTLWQKYHNKSCKVVTAILLFAFPPLFALYFGDFIFFFMCVLFLSFLVMTFYNITKKPMRSDVPKKTYKTFKALYRATSFGSVVGQTFLVIGFFSNATFIMLCALFLLTTSLYFGLLTREAIEIATEKMAINLGYYSKEGAPERKIQSNMCAICGEIADQGNVVLSCKHTFHTECIQGWVFMGKKGFCPCCRENVNFDRINIDTWQKGENLYSSLIDFMRKGIVFLAFFVIFGFIYRLKAK